jgi:glycosyltransferase involved in cell wall biosynthesis
MPDKKKILFLITKGNFGGAQRYVFDLATNLPKSDFEIMVACGEGETLPKMLDEKEIKTIQIKKLVREVKFFDEFKVCKELINIMRTEKPDVIHLNSSKMGGIGAVAGKIAGVKKIIFTAHNWGFNDDNRSFLEKIFYYISHWITIILCDKLIAVSEKTKKDISFLPFTKNKIKVVYNGISDFQTLPKDEARIILASHESEKTIIFSISELHKNKGVDVALKAISRLPKEIKEKIIWSIAGGGEEKDYLEMLAKQFDIEDIVRFLGFVPDARKLLSGADIFLLPSRTEAFPYAPLEAGLAGLPIIATSVGGVPEVIHDMQNGILIHPCNPKEMGEAIIYYLDHPEKMSEFGSEIKKTILTFFSLKKMLSETIKLYQ